MVNVWTLRLPLDGGVTLLMGDLASFRLGSLDLLARRVFTAPGGHLRDASDVTPGHC